MSESTISVYKVQDPRLSVPEKPIYFAKVGGSKVRQDRVPADAVSQSQIRISTTTPSVNIALSRRQKITYNVVMKWNDAGNAPYFDNAVRSSSFGLRAFPLAFATDVTSYKINNATITINTSDYIQELMTYGNPVDIRNRFQSSAPSMPDELPGYNIGASWASGARNPFSSYATNQEEVSRQLVNFVESVEYHEAPSADRVKTLVLVLTENIFAPFLNWDDHEVTGLFGVQKLDITMNLASNLKNRLFCGEFDSLQNYMNNCVVSLADGNNGGNRPELNLLYITPNVYEDYTLPVEFHYPYYSLDLYKTAGKSQAPLNSKLIDGNTPQACIIQNSTVNAFTINGVPKLIYIFVSPRKSAFDVAEDSTTQVAGSQVANISARITNISLTWNNSPGLLSSATEEDLYAMSTKNGLNRSWAEWRNYAGSVLCIDPSQDLGLAPNEASGSRGVYQIQYKLDYEVLQYKQGNDLRTIDFDINTLCLMEGFMTIRDGSVLLSLDQLTQVDVSSAPWSDKDFYAVKKLHGSGFWQDFAKGFSAPFAGLSNALLGTNIKYSGPGSDMLNTMASVSGAVPGIVSKVVPVGKVLSGLAGKGTTGGRKAGGRMSGGVVMSPDVLQRRL